MITSEVAVAYSQCKLKAYFLVCTNKKGIPHEYISILEENTRQNREEYFSHLKLKNIEVESYSSQGMKKEIPIIIEATLQHEDLMAYADVLTRVEETSSKKKHNYNPTLVVGTRKINKEQKLHLAFIAYVLSKLQNKEPASGTIVGSGNKAHKIKLDVFYKEIDQTLRKLRIWTSAQKLDTPPIIMNKHCPYCPFQRECKAEAVKKNDLSVLGGINLKSIQKYQKKGIFTINQLSYLFRPRKQRKRKKNPKIPLLYRPELQALAIRTEKIYIQELSELLRHQVELFLDIEGVPDQDFYYLIGLIASIGEDQTYYSFWANSINEEQQIWSDFIEKVNEYPDAPIYHYGGYDSKAIHQLKERYGNDSDIAEERLVNVNSFIYGKVYFPVRSNTLKELGKLVGASWTYSEASGLQSLVWRHHWDKSQEDQYKKLLITYNKEDCKALWKLTKELSEIIEAADSKCNVDYADQPKKHATEVGRQIHEELEQTLQFAHVDYDKNKIALEHRKQNEIVEQGKHGGQKGHPGYYRIMPSKAGKIIKIKTRRGRCPKDKNQWLRKSDVVAEKIVIDLHFTQNGCRKRVLKYKGYKAYCEKCQRYFLPPAIAQSNNQLFSHNFQAWIIYQRIILRSPYKIIIQVVQDLFGEYVSSATISTFIRNLAEYYSDTEKMLIRRILESPFLHIDETKINIQGSEHYVWVFTDGQHIVFRKTETREATIVHEFLSNYSGIVISDFYAGYDSVNCRQQKCWSHLIRDVNDDLWKEPFNQEFELFVLELKNLIVPILQTVQKYGLKKRRLNKFKKIIETFYKKNIDNRVYKFEVTTKYQKRFQRYRDSLFTFLEEDGIPWNNNMAERAIRYLAIQRKISGTFYDSLVSQYLLLLGISQSCRFQDKPFLKFLLSKEKDIEHFKSPKPKKYTRISEISPDKNKEAINQNITKRGIESGSRGFFSPSPHTTLHAGPHRAVHKGYRVVTG